MLAANHDGQESSRLSFREQAPFAAHRKLPRRSCGRFVSGRNWLNS